MHRNMPDFESPPVFSDAQRCCVILYAVPVGFIFFLFGEVTMSQFRPASKLVGVSCLSLTEMHTRQRVGPLAMAKFYVGSLLMVPHARIQFSFVCFCASSLHSNLLCSLCCPTSLSNLLGLRCVVSNLFVQLACYRTSIAWDNGAFLLAD